ncbi:MAG: hypothetical protein SGI96_15595 [Bacteroidota bacterium]|nr:hypothetical protein [Bacteroidota bacterium]
MFKQKTVILVVLVIGFISIFFSWGKIYGWGETNIEEFYIDEIDPGNVKIIPILAYLIPIIYCILNRAEYLARTQLLAVTILPLLFSCLIVYGIVQTGASFTIKDYIEDDADRFQIGPAITLLLVCGFLIPFLGLALKRKVEVSKAIE